MGRGKRDNLYGGMAKDYRRRCRDMGKLGWSVEPAGRHLVLVSPSGRVKVPIPTSDIRGLRRDWEKRLALAVERERQIESEESGSTC